MALGFTIGVGEGMGSRVSVGLGVAVGGTDVAVGVEVGGRAVAVGDSVAGNEPCGLQPVDRISAIRINAIREYLRFILTPFANTDM